jgi:uncharacterized membrane protein YcaP (DUF421 family)
VDIVVRALVIYLVIVVLFRITGKRTMAQVTTVDLVLLLIISEATQQALLGDDYSITTAVLAIVTLVVLDRAADLVKFKSKKFSRLVEGSPVVLVERGRPLECWPWRAAARGCSDSTRSTTRSWRARAASASFRP